MDRRLLLDLECDLLLDLLLDRLCLEDEGVLLLLERDLDLECLRFSSFLSGSMAADIRDCASRTLFMASSISLLEVSDFRLGETRPAAT